jgi:hypothetical protein
VNSFISVYEKLAAKLDKETADEIVKALEEAQKVLKNEIKLELKDEIGDKLKSELASKSDIQILEQKLMREIGKMQMRLLIVIVLVASGLNLMNILKVISLFTHK